MKRVRISAAVLTGLVLSLTLQTAGAQKKAARKDTAPSTLRRETAIAAHFAPVFHQGLGEEPRLDYFTTFNFDRDWRGDNNWRNAEGKRFPLKAYVYYALSETATHYFIHYAVYHPIDYKGGRTRGRILSGLIRAGVAEGVKRGVEGRVQDAVLAHENDLEGCLVVVEKAGNRPEDGRVVYVETLAHNKFLKAAPESGGAPGAQPLLMQGPRPRLFVEPKGHGMQAYDAAPDSQQRKDCKNGLLTYEYAGVAEDPEKLRGERCGYNLAPIATTLWARARRGKSETFGEAQRYEALALQVSHDGQVVTRKVTLGSLGSAFLGRAGAVNMARPPWGWFDADERGQPLGHWFFDPAGTVKRHFNLGDDFSTVYTGGFAASLK